MLASHFTAHLDAVRAFEAAASANIERAGNAIIKSLKNGGTLFTCGNGGSAADAQHIAAEFTGRYLRERRSLPAFALSVDTSALTAIGNDYGYEFVFSRQLEGLGKSGDILLAISTSGNSLNVVRAVEQAKKSGIATIGLLGRDGGKLASMVDIAITVPSDVTARIQECHILAYHILCEMADEALSGDHA